MSKNEPQWQVYKTKLAWDIIPLGGKNINKFTLRSVTQFFNIIYSYLSPSPSVFFLEDLIKFTFTHIDEADHNREFWVVVDITDYKYKSKEGVREGEFLFVW